MELLATCPCDLCGTPTVFRGTRRCVNCWEVETRLADYLRSRAGRAMAFRLLGELCAADEFDAHVAAVGNRPAGPPVAPAGDPAGGTTTG